MDVVRAIYKLNPNATYRLTSSIASIGAEDIIEWFGPGEMPTQAQLENAWALCLADDADEATAAAQREQADNTLLGLWDATLRNLSANDAVIILWARRVAQIRNDIVVLDTKVQAATYWNLEWQTAATADRVALNDNQKGLLIRDSLQAILELVAKVLIS